MRGVGETLRRSPPHCKKRAETFVAIGRQKEAERDLALAARQADRILDRNIRESMKAHIALTAAQAHLAGQPGIAARELTEAMRYFSASPYRLYFSLTLLLRARSFLRLGRTTRRGRISPLAWRKSSRSAKNLSDEGLRVLYMDQATRLFDEMLAFEAGEKDGAEASFDLGERARAREVLEDLAASSLSGGSPALALTNSQPLLTVHELQRTLPERTLVLKYAVLRDQTLLWILTKRELRLWKLPEGEERLERQVQLARSAMQEERTVAERQALRGL